MDIIGQTIEHKTFGCGVVRELAGDILTVDFQDNAKKFVYPDAFRGFLTLTDQKTQRLVEKQLREREAEEKETKKAEQKKRERLRKLSDFKIMVNSHAIFNIAPERLGQAARACEVSAGTYLSGYSRGLPRVAERIKPNSVCLLTLCPAGKGEQERRIIGLFMAREDFFGEDVHDGVIRGHRQHRIFLPEESWLPFWKYFGPTPPARWGNMAFKYCSAEAVNTILSDMLELLAPTEKGGAMADFCRYFRKINKLRPLEKLGEGQEEDSSAR